MSDAANLEKPAYPILCYVTPWYFRRMGMMAAMLAFFGLYFLYDGQYGYPKANRIADRQVWFEEVVLKSYEEARTAGKLDVWVENARRQGWPTGREGAPPRWVSYAAQNGWPEKPHRYTQKEIDEQFWWGGGVLTGALIVGVVILRNRNKVLRGEPGYFVSPEGVTVRHEHVFRVDKRAWDSKGLAYVWYRPEGSGAERRIVIDDLKYDGAFRVLDDVLANFRGELLEKLPAGPTAPSGEAPTKA
ncbi:MAG: hypothetical protein LDL31_04155 [Prosthecobacter sp.]|jgi:hypothetical protein|nr:hypothetical protein [Prosthecobacter sp.]